MRKNEVEKSLKRFLKRKVSYTFSMLIAFMITGGISLGAGITTEEIQETKGDILTKIQLEREEIKRKIAENERLIKEYNSDFVELVRKGDFYSKPLVPSTQVIFTYQHLDSGKTKDRTDKEFKETIDAINEYYGTRAGRSTLKSSGNIGKDKVMSGNGVAVDTSVFREEIDLGANIQLLEPEMPEINPSVSVNVTTPNVVLGALPGAVNPIAITVPSISITQPGIPSTPSGVNVTVVTPSAVDKIEITAPVIPTPTEPAEKNIVVNLPAAPEGYDPTMIVPPAAPSTPTIVAPVEFTPPALNFVGTGFGQSYGIGSVQNGAKRGGIDANIVIENYENYSTPLNSESNPLEIVAGGNVTKWSNGNINASTTVEYNFDEILTPGSTGRTNAFINELRDHNATIGGNYQMTYGASDTVYTKMFLSHNPAGRHTADGFPSMGGGLGSGWLGQSGGAKTAEFTGTLVLNGSSKIDPVSGTTYEILVGVEHQLWDSQDNRVGYSIFNNKGKITLNSGYNVIGIMIDTEALNETGRTKHNNNQTKNTGVIIINSENSIGIDFGAYTAQSYLPVDVEIGNIEVNGKNNYGYRMKNIFTGNNVYYDDVTVSGGAGKITVGGQKNVGLAIGKSLSSAPNPYTEAGNLNHGVLSGANPISNFFGINVEIVGNEVIGFLRLLDYSANNTNDFIFNNQVVGNFNIGTGATNSTLIRTDKHGIQILADITTTGASGSGNTVAHSNGQTQHIYNSGNITVGSGLVQTTGLSATGTAASSKMNIRNSGTIILGGKESTGMYVDKWTQGESTGTIKMTGSEKNAAISNEGKFNLSGTLEVNGEKSSGLYNTGTGATSINNDTVIKAQNGATGIYGNGGTITLTAGKKLNITVDDTSNPTTKGLAVYAGNGSVINIQGADISVKNGSAGVASFGAGSSINLNGATLEYYGDGYAAYSDGAGKIDLTNAHIILGGNATGLEMDLNIAEASRPIKLSNTDITMMSNDAIVANLKNATGLQSSNLEGTIIAALGGNININPGTDINGTYDKYKVAAVDGGDLTIDRNMDKFSTVNNSDGYFYSRRFLAQRLKLDVAAGVEVNASTDSTYANDYFKGQVVGLEMSSSKAAASVSDTQINLKYNSIDGGAKVSANRTDSGGTGAIGLYINYGEINADSGTAIEVETGSGPVNDKGVGVYAVNGSKVNTQGSIKVAGNKAIGILGMTNREQPAGVLIVNEFGGKAGENTIAINNSGDIELAGEGNIGIYAFNNKPSGTKADAVAKNSENIKIGNSTAGEMAVGIYGSDATLENTGTISTGTGAIGIYADRDSEITNIGTLKLGTNAIGVLANEKTVLNTTTLTLNQNGSGTTGQTAIFYKGKGTGAETQTLNFGINTQNLEKATAVYVENLNFVSNSQLDIGKDGVGIYLKKGTLNNTATNNGIINLLSGKTGAIGMYTSAGKIINSNTININDSTHIGMFASGTGNTVSNAGMINLGADGSTGIYVKDGAKVELNVSGNIVFAGKESVGVFVENAEAEIKDNVAFTLNNEKKNIFVYGKNGAKITLDIGKTLDVNGVGAPLTTGHKTVGIYLENSSGKSSYIGNGKIEASNQAIGLYSKGENDLIVNVEATGAKTTGIFVDGASNIGGTVTAENDAIGVYGDGGKLNIGVGVATDLTLKTNAGIGTGMYLTSGAYATGGDINVENTTSNKNIGVYYSKGTGSSPVTNSSKINLKDGDTIGIYAADGINLSNNSNITTFAGKTGNIGAFVGGNSRYTSNSDITLNGAGGIGIYSENGQGINSTTGKILLNDLGSTSVGMAAENTASVENLGTITDAGQNLGMYISGTASSSGKNNGTITTDKGTGVYVEGAGNSFDGSAGKIEVVTSGIGIYLKNTGANKIKSGILNIASGAVGVYGDNAKIDFTVNSSTSTGAIGVTARNNSVISGNITTGTGSVGAYILDGTVSLNGAVITTGVNTSNTSVGILLDKGITSTYTINNVNVNARNGVGIYLGNDTGTFTGVDLVLNGTVKTEGGVGVYVTEYSTLTTGNAILNINGGAGIYVDKGTANLGIAGNLTFNFLAGGGIGIFNNGGNLTLGNNINVTGSGSLASTSNGSLSSTGNLNVGDGAVGLLGEYNIGTTTPQSILNSGNITASSGGIGLAAMKGSSLPGAGITITNSGTITASGKSSNNASIGIYTDIADVVNTGQINVGTEGIGIYSSNNGTALSIQNDNMKMTGTGGIGVYIKGAITGIVSNNITSSAGASNNTGVILENVTGAPLNMGTISLGADSIGVLAKGTSGTVNGTIGVGNGETSIGLVADSGSNITIGISANISAGDKGIGVYVNGAASSVIINDISKISVGTGGVFVYSKGGNLTFSGNLVADNKIGIVAEGGSVNTLGSSITAKNGGIGAYVKSSAPSFGTTAITVQAGTSEKHSIGIYYDSVTSVGTIPTINQTGNNTIGLILNDSSGTLAGTTIGTTGSDQVGIMVKGAASNVGVTGNIDVSGDKNIGLYNEGGALNIGGAVLVGASSSGTKASIGVYLQGGTYIGTGAVSVGAGSIGVYGVNVGNISQTGASISVGAGAVGIYGAGKGTETMTVTAPNITVGTNKAVGIYGKDINMLVSGNMSVGAGKSVGIVSSGNGNISYTGDITVDNKGTSKASIGIYKSLGTGVITTSSGNWNVGDGGYGIYVQQVIKEEGKADIITSNTAIINNSADMVLGEAAVGIYASGNNEITNSGNITVGATTVPGGNHTNVAEHKNSVGIYLASGSKAVNTAGTTITVNHDHSLGVFGTGAGTKFTNDGIMNIDNGGIGVLVRDGAIAVNNGTINLGGTLAACGASTVGMAAYAGGTIINNAVINVTEGVGMLLSVGSELVNDGTINVVNGTGIEGSGKVVNRGNIYVTGTGKVEDTSGTTSTANIGSVVVDSKGNITINDKYVAIGGTLSTAGNVIVNGAFVDVTTGTPLFNAHSVSGEVRLLSNFASTGNGRTYLIENFVNTAAGTITGNKLTPVTSPLFIAKVTSDGHLVIVKRPYADLTIGKQFDALDKGLDNILENSNGMGRDAEILKGLNEYLDGLDTGSFEKEATRTLAELRGDIYATIQGRMQDINRSFDNSFYELESSYNLTKDSSKYSIIYTDGNYKDSTLGIDDYDYKVMGVLYMKEKEGAEYGSKYGYTLGFAGSKFKFDDGGSKEDVYSLRAGVHNVKNLSDEHKVSLLSRVELGYNRHIAKRKIELNKTYENKADYNTYSVSIDNKLSKTIYTDLSSQLDIYTDLELEYGKIGKFKERAGSNGGLEVQIKDNDYFSAQLGAGVKAHHKIYAGSDISVKVTGDVKYAYELGENYDGNKARLKNGGEGYYSLITPEKQEGKIIGKVGLTLEKANHMGVTFEVEAADEGHKKDSSIKYGVRFNYKF
ncbi:autotransporter-associated N-terminal domain-containing protein [Fusobacterium ulcerans]